MREKTKVKANEGGGKSNMSSMNRNRKLRTCHMFRSVMHVFFVHVNQDTFQNQLLYDVEMINLTLHRLHLNFRVQCCYPLQGEGASGHLRGTSVSH